MGQYIYNHIKHYYRKCPRISKISDEMLFKHKDDDVYETCQTCANSMKAGQKPVY